MHFFQASLLLLYNIKLLQMQYSTENSSIVDMIEWLLAQLRLNRMSNTKKATSVEAEFNLRFQFASITLFFILLKTVHDVN